MSPISRGVPVANAIRTIVLLCAVSVFILTSPPTVWAAKPPELVQVKAVSQDGEYSMLDAARGVSCKGGKIFVVGHVSDHLGYRAYLGRFDRQLRCESTWTYPDRFEMHECEFMDAAVNSAGDILLVGVNYSNSGSAGFIQKIAKNMKEVKKTVNTDAEGSVYPTAISIDRKGFVYVVGQSDGARLLKYDRNLNFLKSGTRNGSTSIAQDTHGLALDSTGNVFVAGTINDGTGRRDIWVGKFDKDLQLVSEVLIPGDNDYPGYNNVDQARKIAVDAKGRVYVVGTMGFGDSWDRVWVGKFDNSLNPLGSFTKTGITGRGLGLAIATDNRGHLFVCGELGTTSPAGEWDTWLGVYDTHLNFIAETIYSNYPPPQSGFAQAMALLPNGYVMLAGSIDGAGTSQDIWLAKVKALRLPRVKKP